MSQVKFEDLLSTGAHFGHITRKWNPNYKKYILSEKNGLSLYVPSGFAHSYLTLDKDNIVYYKLSDYYNPRSESGIIWNDKDLKIKWPTKYPKLSSKDKKLQTYKNFLKTFKYL